MIVFRKVKSLVKIFKEDMKYIFNNPRIALKSMDYEDYWEKMQDIGIKERTRIFSRIIKPGSRVLDIGCGTGANLKYLVEKNNIIAEGIDVSSTAVAAAQNRGIKAWVADVTQDKFRVNEGYDYIIISELLEHLPKPEDLLLKIRNSFKSNLILSVPNIGLYKHRLRLFLGRFPVQWAFHPGEHLRFWTLKDFKLWLDQLGFRDEEHYPANGFPVLYKFFPSLFANTVVHVLSKA